jgi:phosphonate transport system substrate-binding protein
MRGFYLMILFILLIAGCGQGSKDVMVVDFTEPVRPEDLFSEQQGCNTLKVAVSAMSSPKETFSAYEDIIRYIAGQLNVPFEFHQRRTYGEVNKMLEEGQLDFAFICSGAYISLDRETGVELLSVPVTRGNTVYQAYVIVPESSPVQKFTDLRGMNFAYTDLLSNTGYLYPIYRILQEEGVPGSFFSTTILTNAHDVSIQMVSRGLVDGASVHGMVFEYLRENEPDKVGKVRIIERSDHFGIPPIVASRRMDTNLKNRVREILGNMHLDPGGREILSTLLIDRYVEGKDADYDGVRMLRSKLEAGNQVIN